MGASEKMIIDSFRDIVNLESPYRANHIIPSREYKCKRDLNLVMDYLTKDITFEKLGLKYDLEGSRARQVLINFCNHKLGIKHDSGFPTKLHTGNPEFDLGYANKIRDIKQKLYNRILDKILEQ
jgi:hypothetical protein